MQKNPRGGTELQLEYLNQYVEKKLLDKVQITTSVPEKIPLSKKKPNILWQKNSWDQPNILPWFKDKSNHKKYDWYVFNSHWNYENFRKYFDIPTEKCLVIKNGIANITPREIPYKEDEPLRIIHHCTPWRGLNVLLGAMQLLTKHNVQLDVYSNCEVYGEQFAKENDHNYKGLYDQAKKLSNVNYIGYKPDNYIKDHLKDYHMFAYPSIWEETSCISLIESMAAGLYCITTDLGALYETGAEYAMYIPFKKDHRLLAQTFAYAIINARNGLLQEQVQEHLQRQIQYTNIYYGWPKIAMQWSKFLKGLNKDG